MFEMPFKRGRKIAYDATSQSGQMRSLPRIIEGGSLICTMGSRASP